MSKKSKRILSNIVLGLLIFVALALIFYPLVAREVAKRNQSDIMAEYDKGLEQVVDTFAEIRESAHVYNEKLAAGKMELSKLGKADDVYGYYKELNPNGTGIMAKIIIPKESVNVTLPVYHGVSVDVLGTGAGHYPQSSLPVGGLGTHTAISAHSGAAGADLFSNLPNMRVNDDFYIDVLGERLHYRVCEIKTVLPIEIDSIRIDRGRDLATLITCVPYGVNTHRLLVTGERVMDESAPPVVAESDIEVDLPAELSPKFGAFEVWLMDITGNDIFLTHWIIATGVALSFALFVGVIVLVLRRMTKKRKQRRGSEQAVKKSAPAKQKNKRTDAIYWSVTVESREK